MVTKYKTGTIPALALCLCLWFAPAPAAQSVNSMNNDREGTMNSVGYVSSGIGLDEREALGNSEKSYSLKLSFAVSGGEYLSDVSVEISDSRKVPVLKTVSEGPWLLAQLPPGTYSVAANALGHEIHRQIVIRPDARTVANIVWDKSIDPASSVITPPPAPAAAISQTSESCAATVTQGYALELAIHCPSDSPAAIHILNAMGIAVIDGHSDGRRFWINLLPGEYTVVLTVDGQVAEKKVRVGSCDAMEHLCFDMQGNITESLPAAGANTPEPPAARDERYNLKLLFDPDNAAHGTPVAVQLTNAGNRMILDAAVTGECFYGKFHSGHYTVMATADGQTLSKKVHLTPTGLATLRFFQ